MLIKAGVDISRLLPPIRKQLNAIAWHVFAITKKELVITSTYEGSHCEGSLHYANLAIDIRCCEHCSKLAQTLRQVLGVDYDIIIEMHHLHIEYDPA